MRRDRRIGDALRHPGQSASAQRARSRPLHEGDDREQGRCVIERARSLAQRSTRRSCGRRGVCSAPRGWRRSASFAPTSSRVRLRVGRDSREKFQGGCGHPPRPAVVPPVLREWPEARRSAIEGDRHRRDWPAGNNLVRALVAGGHGIRALVRSEEKAQRLLGDAGAELVQGDIENVAARRCLKAATSSFIPPRIFGEPQGPATTWPSWRRSTSAERSHWPKPLTHTACAASSRRIPRARSVCVQMGLPATRTRRPPRSSPTIST